VQCVYETMTNDIGDLRNWLMQTCYDFEQDIIYGALWFYFLRYTNTLTYLLTYSAMDQWHDCLRSCVHAGGGHLEQNALKWMFIHMIHQKILWKCQCNLMHVMAILSLTLKAEVLFTCILVFQLSLGSVVTEHHAPIGSSLLRWKVSTVLSKVLTTLSTRRSVLCMLACCILVFVCDFGAVMAK